MSNFIPKGSSPLLHRAASLSAPGVLRQLPGGEGKKLPRGEGKKLAPVFYRRSPNIFLNMNATYLKAIPREWETPSLRPHIPDPGTSAALPACARPGNRSF